MGFQASHCLQQLPTEFTGLKLPKVPSKHPVSTKPKLPLLLDVATSTSCCSFQQTLKDLAWNKSRWDSDYQMSKSYHFGALIASYPQHILYLGETIHQYLILNFHRSHPWNPRRHWDSEGDMSSPFERYKTPSCKKNCEKLLGLIQSTLQARKRWIFIWTICLKSIYFLTFYIVLSYIVYHVICIYVMCIFSTIYLCIICMRRSCLLSSPFYGSFFGPSCNRWSPELHLEVLRLWEVHPPQVPPVPSNQPKKTMSTRDESEKHAKRSRVSW